MTPKRIYLLILGAAMISIIGRRWMLPDIVSLVLMLAGVIGFMWRDGPPPETQVVAEMPARETTVAPTVASADNTLPPLPTLPSAPSAKARLPERPAPAAAPAIVAVPAAPTLVPPPAPPTTPVLEMRREAPAVGRMEAAPAAAPAPATAPAPASPPRVVMSNTTATTATTTADPLAEVISSLAAGSETLALLLDVQAQAQGRWVPQRATSPPQGTAVLDAQGRLLGHFSLQGRVARWQGAQASAQAPAQAWRAVLPTATKAPE